MDLEGLPVPLPIFPRYPFVGWIGYRFCAELFQSPYT
jgi:hypothetical protein